MIIRKSIKDIFKIIEKFSKEYNVDEEKRKQIKVISDKLTHNAIEELFTELNLHFYVQDENEAIQKLLISNVSAVKNNMFICLIHKIISNYGWEDSDKVIYVRIQKYNKQALELETVLNSVLNLVEFTDSRQLLSINTQKIDNLYSGKANFIVKGAQKSITTTLTGKKKNNTFIAHPATKKIDEKKQITYYLVPLEKLNNAYLSLKNKSVNLICPICSIKYNEDENTINQRIFVKENEITFKCRHKGKHLVEMPFSVNLENHFTKKTTEIEKIMFFINNFKFFSKSEKKEVDVNES